MPGPRSILSQINRVITYLVETGLASDQNAAIERRSSGHEVRVYYPNADVLPAMAGQSDYAALYQLVTSERAFHVQLIDGAVVQLDYSFVRDDLRYHRLTWFPAPHLEDFLTNPEIYIADELYADIVARSIVAFPVRFDFDKRHLEIERDDHPSSHLTLGQYDGCRIPVSRPVTPCWFMDFILRNFYLPSITDAPAPPASDDTFDECLSTMHSGSVHVAVPARPPERPGDPRRQRRGMRWRR
jgi:hypothetical protein